MNLPLTATEIRLFLQVATLLMKKNFILLLTILNCLILTNPTFSQCSIPGGRPDTLFPVINNLIDSFHFSNPSWESSLRAGVRTVFKKQNAYYILGDFTNVGPNHGPGVVLDSTTHAVSTYFKWHIDGTVQCSLPDGNGGFYIGGYFKKIGDSSRNYFAHINSNGQPLPMRLDFNNAVRALYKKNDTLFIGGAFTTVNNQSRTLFAIYSLSGDSLMSQSLYIPVQTDNEIVSMAAYGDSLFLAGYFNVINDRGLIQYNTKTLAYNPNWHLNNAPYEKILQVEIGKGDSTLFYVSAGSSLIRAVNAVNGQERYTVAVSLDAGAGRAYSMKVVNRTLFVAGDFHKVTRAPVTYLKKGFFAMDIPTGNILAADIRLNNFGRFVTAYKDKLYVSGIFNTVSDSLREHFVVLDTGTLAVNPWNLSPTDPLATLSFSAGKIFVGGFFNGVNSLPRRDLAAIDIATNAVLPLRLSNPLGLGFTEIKRTAVYGDTLFVFGIYSGGPNCEPDPYLTKFVMINLATGQLVTPPNMSFSQMDYMAIEDNFLYTSVDNQVRRYFLPNLVLDVTWGVNFNGVTGLYGLSPTQLFFKNDKVYLIGDNRNTVGCGVSNLVGGLVSIDKNNSQSMSTSFYIHPEGLFERGFMGDSLIYVMGGFNNVNNLPRYQFAALNIYNGSVANWTTPFTGTTAGGFINLSIFHRSAIPIRNRSLWFTSGNLISSVSGLQLHGIDAVDTATGTLMPAVAKLRGWERGFGDYSTGGYGPNVAKGGTICFDDENNTAIVGGMFNFINGESVSGIAKLYYQTQAPPSSSNLSIIGRDTLIAGADSIKYYVQNSSSSESYSWSYTGTGVEIKMTNTDTVYLKVSAAATPGILKVLPLNYCGTGAVLTKSIAIGTTDLSITSSNLSTTTIPTGTSFTVSYVETNSGNTSAALHKVDFYLSYNNILTPGANGDIKLGSDTMTSILPPGSNTGTITQSLVIPCSLTPANYYLFIVADGAKEVPESDENNNSVLLPLTVTTGMSSPFMPTITANPGTTVCAPQSVILTANSIGCTSCVYSWSTGQNGPSITVTTTGSYTATATNTCGSSSAIQTVTINPSPNVNIIQADTTICTGSSVTLNASGASSYAWSPAAGLNSTNTATVIASPLVTTRYKVTGTGGGCSNADSILVTVSPITIPTVDISYTGCPSSTLQFSAVVTNGGSSPSLQWFINGTAAGSGANITLNNVANGAQVVCRLSSSALCVNPQNVSDTVVVNCIPTAVVNIDGLEKAIISPNPTSGNVHIQLKLTRRKQVEFRMTDLAGKTVYTYNAGSVIGLFDRSIDMHNWPAGVYLLKCSIGGKTFTQKIVKENRP